MRRYQYINPADMADRFLPTLQGLETEHYMTSVSLQVLTKAPGESEESFENRKRALEQRLASIEQAIAEWEARLGPAMIESVKARAQELAATAKGGAPSDGPR